MSSQHKIMALVGVMLSILWFGFVKSFLPAWQKYQTAAMQVKALQVERSILLDLQSKLNKKQQEMTWLQKDVEPIQKQLSSDVSVSKWISLVALQAQQNHLEVNSIKPGKILHQSGYLVLPIELILQGRYHEFARFIAGLANGYFGVRFADVSISGSDKDEKNSTLNIKLKILLYMLRGKVASTQPFSQVMMKQGHYQVQTQRDPFESTWVDREIANTDGLAKFPINQLKFIGQMNDGVRVWGLVQTPGKQIYHLKEGEKIENLGEVLAIKKNEITILSQQTGAHEVVMIK